MLTFDYILVVLQFFSGCLATIESRREPRSRDRDLDLLLSRRSDRLLEYRSRDRDLDLDLRLLSLSLSSYLDARRSPPPPRRSSLLSSRFGGRTPASSIFTSLPSISIGSFSVSSTQYSMSDFLQNLTKAKPRHSPVSLCFGM